MEILGRDTSVKREFVKDMISRLDDKYQRGDHDAISAQPDTRTQDLEKQASNLTSMEVSPSLSSRVKSDAALALDEIPKIMVPIKRLSFETRLNQVSVSNLTVHNQGLAAIRFEWAPSQKPNLFNVINC